MKLGYVPQVIRISGQTFVAQIGRAMTQVDQVTQQNASAAEELASTAEELATQAEALREVVAFFRLEDASGAPRGTAAPAGAARARRPDRDVRVTALATAQVGRVMER